MDATVSEAEAPLPDEEASTHTVTPEAEETLAEQPAGALTDAEKILAKYIDSKIVEDGKANNRKYNDLVSAAYEDNKKMVRGPRIDKEEFRKVAIEKALGKLTATEDSATVREITVATMEEMLHNKTMFCPINDTERIMLETIPVLEDFSGVDSIMDGKSFLAKVKELHGVENATTRALMVSLCRKGFYRIIGIQSGQKHTTIQLQERGIRYLKEHGLLKNNVA